MKRLSAGDWSERNSPMAVGNFAGTRHRRRRTILRESPLAQAPSFSPPQTLGARLPARPAVRRGEIVRKTIHMLPGVVPFAMFLAPHPHPLPWYSLVVVTVLTALLTLVYIASKKIVQRPGERDFYSTCLSYPACILGMLLVFPQHPEFVCALVVILALGDGSACLGGKFFGGRKLPWNSDKTWAGTACFIAVAAPVATIAYFLEANVNSLAAWGDGGPIAVPLAMAAACGVAATLVASLAESWKSKLTDNLRVGLAAGVTLIATHYLCAGWFLA
jgi:dolichol kinase